MCMCVYVCLCVCGWVCALLDAKCDYWDRGAGKDRSCVVVIVVFARVCVCVCVSRGGASMYGY
jgi:hypothetical protein